VTVVVARFKEYEDWLVESSHKLHGKGKNEALKEEKLAQVSTYHNVWLLGAG
jgi:hypothetical protein